MRMNQAEAESTSKESWIMNDGNEWWDCCGGLKKLDIFLRECNEMRGGVHSSQRWQRWIYLIFMFFTERFFFDPSGSRTQFWWSQNVTENGFLSLFLFHSQSISSKPDSVLMMTVYNTYINYHSCDQSILSRINLKRKNIRWKHINVVKSAVK